MKSEIEVPDGWELVELSDVAEINKGLSYKSKDYGTRDDGIIFINLKCILKGGGFNKRGIKYYRGDYKNEHLVKSGDIIIANTDLTRNGDIVGAPIFVPNLNGKTCISMDLSSLNFRGEIIDKKYGYYYLCQGNIREFMRRNSSGSTVLHLNLQAVKKLKFLLPPIEEQQKIADILSKIDEQIDFTEKIIDKTEELKKGLMRKLLTKGVGHTEFKETELRMIPKEWEIIKTEKQIELSTGFAFKSSEYSENNIDHKLLRGANITRGKLRWKKEITKFWKYTPDFEKFLLEENDIVIGMDGSLVGRNSAIITKKDLPLLLVQRVARLKTKEGLNPKYLFYHIDNGRFIKYVDTVKTNTGIPHISGKNIQNYKITFPPIGEQNRIASILSKVDEYIQDNKKELKHLQELKKGLMQDLLTGKVRVTT